MTCVNQEVKDLFNLLEHEFLPLDLASKVEPLRTKISKIVGKLSSASLVTEVQLSQYVPSSEKLVTLRLLQQGLESDELRNHLTNFAHLLYKGRSMVYPPTKTASKVGDMLPGLADIVDKEHKRLLARKSIIEKRKEEHERHLLEMEREEESKRLKLQKITEEAEVKRLASEYEQRKNLRILREIEERELEEARVLLSEAEKHSKKKGEKLIIEGEKVTKQTLMELALTEQLRERQEKEKKLQKLEKTMDHLERAKREEAVPLIEAAFQQRLVEEKALHEREQQQEVKVSRHPHDGDLTEKNRLSRMVENKTVLQERVMGRRQAEFNRLRRAGRPN